MLALLVSSCASHLGIRHQSPSVDVRPLVPEVYVPTPVVIDEQRAEAVPHVAPEGTPSAAGQTGMSPWLTACADRLSALCADPLFTTTQLGLYVYDLTDGVPVYAMNAAQRMRPASCQKLVTAITALHCLKGSYSLQTDIRITGQVQNGVLNGDLIIVGGMDPLVTPSELTQAAATLRQQLGLQRIDGRLIYDMSMREDVPMGWGWCWDDDYGPLSALMVDGKDTFDQHWKKALSAAGIRLRTSAAQRAQAPAQSRSVLTIRHGIDQLLVPMMKKSDNIFAECLFYQTAASTGKKLAGRKQAAQCTGNLLSQLGLSPDDYVVADGSGLSLYNYLSAEMLVALLRHAWTDEDIHNHLLPSLPIASVDGTLEKRMADTPAAGNVWAKTGSVSGISSLAGYISAANGHVLAFAILNQGVPTMSCGRDFQDKVCVALCQ